jgi:DnaK suppressor protein
LHGTAWGLYRMAGRSKGSKKSPFTKKELNEFKRLLLEERERLARGLRNMDIGSRKEAEMRETSADPEKSSEVGTEMNQLETQILLASNETEMLNNIDDALKRIEDGTYGICEGTGEPIPKKRLEVFPAARYSVQYQSKLEKEQSGRW